MRLAVLFVACAAAASLVEGSNVGSSGARRATTGSVHSQEQKVHGYVTAVHSPASFDIDDYRILRDRSVTIEFVTEEDDQNVADHPKEIRVGSEIEIRGDYDPQTHELKAKSLKVYTRESRNLKRTAILDQVPQLHQNGMHWAGSFRADGQTIVVDQATTVSIVPTASQKSAAKREAKQAKPAASDDAPAPTAEQLLSRLNDVHVNMYVSYEGVRLDDGRIEARKVQFRDVEMTSTKAQLWKSFTPKVTALKGQVPGSLSLGAGGKLKLTPNPEVQDYVRKLGQRLVPASQSGLRPGDPNRIPFQFFVADAKGVNASATPNGVIVVHRELLAALETEGQLAAVLGHEIAHATQEHALRQVEFHKNKRLLLKIGAVVAEAYGKYNVRELLTLASAAIANGYQRYLENQADRIGMEYMLAAGYDPREAPRVWKALSIKGGDSPTNFFWSNHDNNTTRRSYLMSELAVNYKGVEFDSLVKDSNEFQRICEISGGPRPTARTQHETAVVRLPKAPQPDQKAASAAKPAPAENRPQPAPQNPSPPAPRPVQSATVDPNLKPRTPAEPPAPTQQPPQPTQLHPDPPSPGPAPRTDAATLDRAYDALRARDYPAAIAGFRQAIEAAPANVGIRKDLAYTYLRTGENSLALDQFREAMRLAPADTPVALEYAFLCHESTGPPPCPNESRRIFDRIRHSATPSDAATTAEHAFQNIDAPLAAGIERWKKAIDLGADDFSAHYDLASLAEQRDDLPLAAEHYEKAWRRLPDRRSVLVDLGRVWKALGRDEDADAALLAATHGGEPRAAEMAREVLPERYPYVSEFRRALALDPKNIDLRRELAYLLLSMGREAAAEQEFRALVDTAPDDLLSVTQLAFLLHGRGDQAGAQPLFDRVLAGRDEDLANRVRAVLHQPQVLQNRGATQPVAVSAKEMADRSIKAGYLKDAVKYLETAAEADPADAEVMLRLAWAYNNLHQDVAAIHWFDLARKSSDPVIADEAQKAWSNLRSPTARVRTTGWLYPLFSTRWRDLFGYGQVKTEFRTGLGFRPYVSLRIVGDTRQTEGVALVPQYLSESSLILGVGIATNAWHGLTAWAEAGRALNYLSHQQLHDYRGGVSMAYGTGHTLRGESPGWFASTSTDAVFLSRFGNDILVYNQERIGYTAGPASFRAQIGALAGLTFDDQRQYWANYTEMGLTLRFSGSALPPSMYFTFDAVRGVYLVNAGNPRAPNYFDFRAGVWYAFTR